MKKIILVCFLFLMAQSLVVADEIIDAKGNIVPCKVETIMDGLIEYKKNGVLHSFARENDQAIYNDYVDVRVISSKKISSQRFFGKIIHKDIAGVKIRNEDGDMMIPWFRVKFVGVYKPE